jgi:hypothetical protein
MKQLHSNILLIFSSSGPGLNSSCGVLDWSLLSGKALQGFFVRHGAANIQGIRCLQSAR